MIFRILFSLGFIFMISFTVKSQNVGVGADVMYNFQTESFGAGARVNFFPNNNLSFVPQISYYPGFIKTARFGDYDWANDQYISLNVTIAMDYCIANF